MRLPVHRLAQAVASSVLSVSIAVMGMPPAAAESTCYGRSCAGLWPQASGCVRGAVRIASVVFDGGPTIRLIYSQRCNAFWAKAEASSRLSADFSNLNYIQVRGNTTMKGRSLWYRYANEIESGRSTWTQMVPGNYWTNACWVSPDATSDPSSENCTARY